MLTIVAGYFVLMPLYPHLKYMKNSCIIIIFSIIALYYFLFSREKLWELDYTTVLLDVQIALSGSYLMADPV